MNLKQKRIIWVGIALIALMGLYPPWVQHLYDLKAPAGYGLIFSPPEPHEFGGVEYMSIGVDLSRLFIQWFIVIAVAGGLIITFKDARNENNVKA